MIPSCSATTRIAMSGLNSNGSGVIRRYTSTADIDDANPVVVHGDQQTPLGLYAASVAT
jgi:hypothetical protein